MLMGYLKYILTLITCIQHIALENNNKKMFWKILCICGHGTSTFHGLVVVKSIIGIRHQSSVIHILLDRSARKTPSKKNTWTCCANRSKSWRAVRLD